MYRRIALLIGFAIALPVLADAPFEDISYPAALKKARENDKIVIIDFYTTWCGPCKMLDRRTWPDEDVRKWLDKHAVCMKVDAEVSKEFARRFKVRAYPTIVFIKADGSVLDSIVGFRTPRDFLEEAEGALTGKDALTRAREAFEAGDTEDPMRRSRYADKLVNLGKHKEALENYLWCFDHGEEHRPSYSGVRVSFLLSDIKNLGDVYPPALAALKERRDRCESIVFDFVEGKKLAKEKKRTGLMGLWDRIADTKPPVIFDVAGDLAALNDALGEKDRTLKTYDKLITCDRREGEMARRAMFYRIEDDLLAAHRYDDYLQDCDPVPATAIEIQAYTLSALPSNKIDEKTSKEMRDYLRVHTLESTTKRYEACVGIHRDDLAIQVKDMLVEFDTSFLCYDMIVSSAVRAGRYDLLQSLADDARAKLDESDAKRIADSVRDALATPEATAALEKNRTAAEPVVPTSQPVSEAP